MDYQAKVLQIMENRRANLPKLEVETKKVRALRSGITQICDFLRQIKAGTDVPDFTQDLAILEKENLHLLEAEEEIEHIRSRFARKTINIGVSGQARVGKSTLLQSLSGLTDDQIPTGGDLPVTAVRSRIFNQAAGIDPKAIIRYYDEATFFSKYIVPHLEIFGWSIRTLSEFKDFLFPKDTDGLDLHKASPTEASIYLDRLKQAQEALPAFRPYLTGQNETLTDLRKLRRLTAYPTKEEKKDSEARKRLYLAVEDIQIFCHFPSLDGVGIGLVDLPGFGEASKSVNAIQIEGLENEVDHVVLIWRTTAISLYAGSTLVSDIGTLHGIQKSIRDRGNFVSIIINKDESLHGIEEKTKTLLDDINDKINNGISNKNFMVYTIKAVEATSTAAMLEAVLTRLAEKLPIMDQDTLDSYRSKLNMGVIKQTLEQIQKTISDFTRTKPTTQAENIGNGSKLRGKMATTFDNERQRIAEKKENNETYYHAIDMIKALVKKSIENDLFFSENQKGEWEVYANNQINIFSDPTGFVTDECHRIRIKIAEKYEALDQYYTQRIEDFFNQVAGMFRTNTGVFLPNDCTGSRAIREIYEKLQNAETTIASFEDAFYWLKSIHFDFRQNIYPDMMTALQPVVPFDFETKKHIFDTKILPANRAEYPQKIKDFLRAQAKTANANVADRLMQKADFVEDFIYATLEHFEDIIIRRNEERAKVDFPAFCEIFRALLWPELYGNGKVSKTQQFTELKRVIATTLEALNQ
ncbi:hypothetical protein ACYULU_07625 [Breznakiellaceae bacterium SP9]